jgi:hypothetical protein
MTRYWLIVMVIFTLAGSLAGCRKRPEVAAAEDQQRIDEVPSSSVLIFNDRETGCQYLTPTGSGGLTPRIAADGHSHMGCKGLGR